MNNKNKFLLFCGIFLLLDGVLSIIFGHACLNNCMNNNLIGDGVRVFRALLGLILIIMVVKKNG